MFRKVLAITSLLFLTSTLSTVFVTPTAGVYPFEDIFKTDLLNIANNSSTIENIYIKSWLDTRPSGHLLAFIRINYTAGLSDWEKIDIQNDVHHQLESKWYIAIVERNGIYCYFWFDIDNDCPPWPGFVIGDLNVAFKKVKPTIDALVDITPSTLNLKIKDKQIKANIKFPEGYSVGDIDLSTILMNGVLPVEGGNLQGNSATVNFNTTALTSHTYHTLGIKYGNVTLTITGNLTVGTRFEGSDTVKVIFGGDADLSGLVELDDYDIWLDNFGKKPNKCPLGLYPDFNNDGLVDMLDFFVWRENFGATVPPQP